MFWSEIYTIGRPKKDANHEFLGIQMQNLDEQKFKVKKKLAKLEFNRKGNWKW